MSDSCAPQGSENPPTFQLLTPVGPPAASRGFFLTEAVPKRIIAVSVLGESEIPLCHTDMPVLSGSVPGYLH
jgi:hypothetical protein